MIILHHTKESRDDCGPLLWYCILLHCILHLIASISACITPTLFNKFEPYEMDYHKIFIVISIMRIWPCYIYFEIDDYCQRSFILSYKILWIAIEFEAIVLLVSVSLAIIILLIVIICKY